MSDQLGVRIGSPRGVTTTATTKVVVDTNEDQFLALPEALNDLLRPALMQFNVGETAVELFYIERVQAEAIVEALGKLDPPITATIMAETVSIPIGRRAE